MGNNSGLDRYSRWITNLHSGRICGCWPFLKPPLILGQLGFFRCPCCHGFGFLIYEHLESCLAHWFILIQDALIHLSGDWFMQWQAALQGLPVLPAYAWDGIWTLGGRKGYSSKCLSSDMTKIAGSCRTLPCNLFIIEAVQKVTIVTWRKLVLFVAFTLLLYGPHFACLHRQIMSVPFIMRAWNLHLYMNCTHSLWDLSILQSGC